MKWFLYEYKYVLVGFGAALLVFAFVVLIAVSSVPLAEKSHQLQEQCQTLRGNWNAESGSCVFS